jgi:hypothetical protein
MATYTSSLKGFLSGLSEGLNSSGTAFGLGLCVDCSEMPPAAFPDRFDAINNAGDALQEIDVWALGDGHDNEWATQWDRLWPHLEAWLKAWTPPPAPADGCGPNCTKTYVQFPPLSGLVCQTPSFEQCCCSGEEAVCRDNTSYPICTSAQGLGMCPGNTGCD